MADQQTINENQTLALADKTGLSDIFSDQNKEEIKKPFPVLGEIETRLAAETAEFFSGKEKPVVVSPEEKKRLQTAKPYYELESLPKFRSDEFRKKGLFEKMFGYNPEADMPWGYERMTEFQRAIYRVHLGMQNIVSRVGLGAAMQTKGTFQLLLPKSIEEYLPTDTQINPFRLEEDKYYEKRIQSELRKKKKDIGLSAEENEQLKTLDETLPSNWQRSPEFLGRVNSEIVRIATASELTSMISIPGGGTLNDHLSEAGRRILGRRLLVASEAVKNRPVISVVLDALAKEMEMLGPNAGTLFAWGILAAEPPEGEADPVAFRAEEGMKMVPWALAGPVLTPTIKGVGATKAGQVAGEFMKRAITKVTTPIADKLARMKANEAKKFVIKRGMTEADDLFFRENARYMNSLERKKTKEVLEEVTGRVVELAKGTADDIVSKIEALAGRKIGSKPVAQESIIPASQRAIETVGDDIVNSTTALVENKTKLATIRQPNGKYAVLDVATQQELAVDIPRHQIGSALEQLVEGKKFKIKGAKQFRVRPKTKLTITEETELKRAMRRLEVATNKSFRAGVKAGTEKTMKKVITGRERLQTVKAGNREQWQNVEFARELVKEFVPTKEQGLFMRRLIKAKTEGGLDKILDDIGKHLDRNQVRASVDSIRGALKESSSKYRDKTGKFAKAPDSIKPILVSLDKSMEGITKLSQEAGADIAGFGQLADDMVAGLNSAISGKGEVLGIPEGLADDLYGLAKVQGETLTADNIESLAQLTKLVIHRAEQSHLIDISGDVATVVSVVDDSLTRILPRKIVPRKTSIASKFKRLYGVDSDHPTTLVEKMFGEGSNMSSLLDDLYEGEVKAFGVMRNSYDIVKEYMRNNNLDDDIFNGLKKKVTVKIGGKDVQLARDDILGIAMSSRDPWVFDQMTRTSGYDIGGNDTIRVTTDELAEMFSMLTKKEMQLGAVMFELNNSYLSQLVNETSIHLNGTKLATYPQYYPSHRSLNKKLYGNKWAMRTAETQSNFMPRMGGKGRMKFKPFSRELMDYIQNSAMYNGIGTPMRSMKTVLKNPELQAQLKNMGYTDELSNFIDILSRSEGMYSDSSVLDAIGSQVLNTFTKGVLGGRVSTIGTQIGSIPAAKAIVPSKYFKASSADSISKAVDDLMTSDFFWFRWTGRRVSVELGDTASKSSLSHFIFGKTPLTEKPLTGLIWGDKQAIGNIYLAARRQVADTTKLAGDDLTRAAIKIAEEATRKTQPNWSVLTRSKLASDPSVFKRSLTMFRTAQEAQFNIWKRANVAFERSAKGPKDIAKLADSYQAVLESQMSVALWKATWKRARELGVTSVAGWLGIYAPERDDPFAEDVAKSMARTGADIAPLGRLIETAVEGAYDQAFKGGARFNTSVDPITTMLQASVSAADSVVKWSKKIVESRAKREGFTTSLIPTSLDDLLNEISTSEADKRQKKKELSNQIQKDVLKAIRATLIVVGGPVGPLDEWIAPGLRRSKHALVTRVNGNNASDPIGLQKDLDKFLTLQKELQIKADKKGLTPKEANLAFNMDLIKKSQIDPMFAVDDVVGEQGENFLDSVTEALKIFWKENK